LKLDNPVIIFWIGHKKPRAAKNLPGAFETPSGEANPDE
jgi:hypothetical protein